MSLTHVGEMTIGATLPGVVAALAAAQADLDARVAALASFEPSITPPSIEGDLAVAAAIIANLEASVGITPPSVELQVQIIADVLAVLRIQLEIIVALGELFAVAGVHVYRYSGTAAGMGAELTAELAGGLPGGAGIDHVDALVLATQVSATWTAMSSVFKVAP